MCESFVSNPNVPTFLDIDRQCVWDSQPSTKHDVISAHCHPSSMQKFRNNVAVCVFLTLRHGQKQLNFVMFLRFAFSREKIWINLLGRIHRFVFEVPDNIKWRDVGDHIHSGRIHHTKSSRECFRWHRVLLHLLVSTLVSEDTSSWIVLNTPNTCSCLEIPRWRERHPTTREESVFFRVFSVISSEFDIIHMKNPRAQYVGSFHEFLIVDSRWFPVFSRRILAAIDFFLLSSLRNQIAVLSWDPVSAECWENLRESVSEVLFTIFFDNGIWAPLSVVILIH